MKTRVKEQIFIGVAGAILSALLIWAGGQLLGVTILEADNEEQWDAIRSLLNLHPLQP